ncbi:MAG: hypothetical protein AAF436_10210 [Myxococcota bacterium]
MQSTLEPSRPSHREDKLQGLVLVLGLGVSLAPILMGCDPTTECDTDDQCGQREICADGTCEPDFRPPSGTGGTGGSGAGASGGTGGGAGVAAPCGAPAAGAFTILDQEFAESDWSETTTITAGGDSTGTTAGQETSGGDDGAYRSMNHSINNPTPGSPGCEVDACSFTLQVFHEYQAGAYDPSDAGPATSIDYAESHVLTEPAVANSEVAWSFAVWQDGTRYRVDPTARDLPNIDATSGWVTVELCDLTPDDFLPEGLDFAGSEMTFGYFRATTHTTPGSTQTNIHGIDNFQVAVE